MAHLPADVERFYRDAQRVLDAGVPDAAAVQEHPGPAIHFQAVERGEPFRDSASASLAVSKELAPIAARPLRRAGSPPFGRTLRREQRHPVECSAAGRVHISRDADGTLGRRHGHL